MKRYRVLLLIHGLFYFVTGIWPLVHLESFLWVTGPKTDIWLVQAEGLTITAASIGMLTASFQKFIQPGVIITGILFAAFLTGIDVYYSLTDVISDIYLYDAVAEVLLIISWIAWAITFRGKKELN
jgi:hypothetical protein